MDETGTIQKKAGRLNRAFGPVIAGLIIDSLDLATFGPLGLYIGPPVGFIAGYWMGRALGLSRKSSTWCAIAAAIYFVLPLTEFIPLATIAGAFARYQNSFDKREIRDDNNEIEISSSGDETADT